jgi:hypothetical protein
MPGVRTVDEEARTGSRFRALLEKITHRGPNGEVSLNEQAPEIRDIMEDANEMDVDVVLTPTGTNTSVIMGEGIANHRRFVEIGVAVGLGAVALLGVGGVILRKRHSEPSSKK